MNEYVEPTHNHRPLVSGVLWHCPGCGTAYCKICDAYGDHLSNQPHPRPKKPVKT